MNGKMRVGILANSYLEAFKIYEQLHDLPDCELFVMLSPLPHRAAWLSILANFARMVVSSMSPSHWQLRSVPSNRRVVFLPHAANHAASVAQLRNMNLDVGLDRSGSDYSDQTTKAFRLGILRVRVGGVSSGRLAVSLERSLGADRLVNVTVFFVDPLHNQGIPVVSDQVEFSKCKNLREANQHLSDTCSYFFRKAIVALSATNELSLS